MSALWIAGYTSGYLSMDMFKKVTIEAIVAGIIVIGIGISIIVISEYLEKKRKQK